MATEYAITLAVSVIVLGYLLVAMVRPEKL